jgi:tetratricopeptide (TPR) repeat protein
MNTDLDSGFQDEPGYWEDLAGRLRREATVAEGPAARDGLRLSLVRVLAEKLGRPGEAAAELERLLGEEAGPLAAELSIEELRMAATRDPRILARALERLAHATPDPEVRIAAWLQLSRILARDLADPDGARSRLDAASELDPDDRLALWTRLAGELESRGDVPAAPAMERLRALTADGVLRAFLAQQLAAIRRRQGDDGGEAAALFEAALALDEADWWLLNGTAREGAGLDRCDLSVRAWERLAFAAMEPPPESAGEPAGAAFQGVERGKRAAAVAWWMSGWLRERRLDDVTGALAAIENAADHLPGSAFLEAERARLRTAAGEPGAAVAEVDLPNLGPAQRCALALAAGLPGRVREIAAGLPPGGVSPLLAALAAATGAAEDGEWDESQARADPATWLAARPDHPGARALAAELVAADGGGLAGLIAAEGPGGDPWWSAPEPDEAAGGFGPVIRELGRALSGEGLAGLRTLAGFFRSPEIRAPLLQGAARFAEEGGALEQGLELARAAAELAGNEPRIAELILRLLRRARRHEELASRLGELAASAPDPRVSTEAQLERALLLEHALGNPAEAAGIAYDLAESEPGDVPATFTAARIALRLCDWDRALGFIDRLAESLPEDRPRLDLLAGEILLLTLGRDSEAGERFARAAGGLAEPLATAARLCGIQAARERGDPGELERLLAAQAERGNRDLWLPELREAARAARGVGAVPALSEGDREPDAVSLLWRVLAGTDGPPERAGELLARLGNRLSPGRVSGACRTAALLLRTTGVEGAGLAAADLESAEALWHATERLEPTADPEVRAEWIGLRLERSSDEDPFVRTDWLLDRAEALEDAGRTEAGLAVVRQGIARLPDHPGLLEAEARLAEAAGDFAGAADACGRLARAWFSQEEKATALTRAAALLLHGLQDAAGAERILREALRRVPNHVGANRLLERLLNDRGDDGALAEQLESRIAAEIETPALVALYQEQADRLLAMEDAEGAIEAIENLLLLDATNAPAHRMKIDILSGAGRFEEAVEALDEFAASSPDPVERRTAVWRSAELRAGELKDFDGALEALRTLWSGGDEHPQTLRVISRVAEQGARWEEADAALDQLARRISEPFKRAGILRERARILLEHLFEDEAAEQLLEEVLGVDPTDISALQLALQFKDEEGATAMLSRAEAGLQVRLDETPLDPETIARLREISDLLERPGAVANCDAVSAVIGGAGSEDLPGAGLPVPGADHARLRALLLHPDERGSAASEVLRLAASLTGEVFAAAEGFPEVPRGAFVGRPAEDPLATWTLRWAASIGAPEFDVARYGEDPRGSVTLPRPRPAVAVNSDLTLPLAARNRFFLARHIWRAACGTGSFQEGDAATPLRWTLALAAACLGDKAPLPLPTDSQLVERARKAMPRKLRKILTEPCRALLSIPPQQLRAWTAALSHSADRFGLLVSGDLAGAVNWIVEESAGPNGLRQLAERPAETLAKVPRGRQLIRFALSPDYLAARELAGASDEGGAS